MNDSKAVHNGFWNVLSTASVMVVGAIGSVLIVRSLSTTQYGTFQYYAWLAGVLGIFGTLALPRSLTKIASELLGKGERAEARSLALWVAVGTLGLNLLLALPVLVWAMNRDAPQRTYLLIIAALLIFHGLSRVFTSTFWAHERFRDVTTVNVIAAGSQLLLIVATFVFGWGVVGFLVAVNAYHVVTAVLLGFVLLARLLAGPVGLLRPSRAVVVRYLRFSVPSTLVIFFQAIVWQRSEVFFLERYSTFEQVGFYGLAFTIFSVFLALGWALMNGFHPAISRAFGAGDTEGIERALRRGLLLAGLYALPITLGAWSSMAAVLVPLYGAKMLPAVPIALILFVPLVLAIQAELYAHALSALDMQWLAVRIGLGLAGLNIGLNFLLIPPLGATGAAISNALAQTGYCLLLVAFLRRRTPLSFPLWDLAGLGAIALVTALALPLGIQFVLPGLAGVLISVAISVVAYLLLVARLGFLQKSGADQIPVLARLGTLLARRPGARKRILHVVGDRKLPSDPEASAVSGVVRAALELARAQVERGHDVRVVTVGDRAWTATWQGVHLVMLRASPLKRLTWSRRTLDLRVYLPVLLYTWRHDFDVVHSHLYYYQRLFRARRRVVHFHADPLYEGSGGADVSMKAEAARIILASSDAQLAVSAFVAGQLRRCLGPGAKIHVVDNGVDLERYRGDEGREAWRERLGIRPGAVAFLFAGAITPEKGLAELAEAFAGLGEELPDAHLVLAGARGLWGTSLDGQAKHRAYERRVTDLLDAARDRGRLHVLGDIAVADMPAVYAAADVVVVPSVWQEAFGLVALEAFASGRPVIASEVGGLAEVVGTGKQPLVPPGDVAALRGVMLRLARDPEERARLSALARATAPAYSWKVVANAVENAYVETPRRTIDALEQASV